MNNNHTTVSQPDKNTPLPPELTELIDDIAKNVHDTWVASRKAEGWVKGPERNDKLKTHPCLVPYEDYRNRNGNMTVKRRQRLYST